MSTLLEARNEYLEAKLVECVEELLAAKRAIDDLNVQCKFWRQAAEHAVNGWNKLEDAHEALLEKLRALSAAPAPPDAVPDTLENVTVDVGLGPMRLLEDETPIKEK